MSPVAAWPRAPSLSLYYPSLYSPSIICPYIVHLYIVHLYAPPALVAASIPRYAL